VKAFLGVDLTGRTALVTGAARRVGAEIARGLAESGARVIVHYRSSESAAASLVEELDRSTPGTALVRADLARPEEIERLMGELNASGLRPDILVNSASTFEPTPVGEPVGEPGGDGWQATLAINLTAPYLLAMHLVSALDAGQSGDVVNVADVWGERPLGGHLAYSVSKSGLLMLTRGLARELAPRIRVNAVNPGPVLLPESYDAGQRRRALRRTLLGREGSARDVANAVLFLVGGTDYATGSVVTVDGGRSVM
jgi:pteridine reductase